LVFRLILQSISEENLVAVLQDLFFGGSICLPTALNFAILHMIKNPEKQRKLYEEIRDTVGLTTPVAIKHKPKFVLNPAG
jgi:cytochrome P450